MIIETAPTRRNLLGVAGTGVLSLAAIGLLANEPALAAASGKGNAATAGDIDILNVALSLEHEAIEAYQIGAESGLLAKGTLGIAVVFQGHHKGHRDALASTIQKLGGKAVQPRSRAEYVTSLNAAAIKSETDIVRLAQRLEKGAANAYLGVIPALADRNLAQVAARLAADEVAHWTELTGALGDKFPEAPFMFG